MNTLPELTGARLWRKATHFFAWGFGCGRLPRAPGTFGTLAAVPPCGVAEHYLSWPLFVPLTVLLFVIGIWLCGRTARDLGIHDHPSIVWDEMVGYFITMTAAPPGWPWLLVGIFLFRLFDIVKPWPIGWIDRRLEGGFGIMFDDALAGIYACLSLQILARLA